MLKNGLFKNFIFLVLPAITAFVLTFPILIPDNTFVGRDFATFNWPLKKVFWELSISKKSFAEWNPYINGGQPILSNPNYSAFYPPHWLLPLLGFPWGLQVMVFLHLLWGGVGASLMLEKHGVKTPLSLIGGSLYIGGWFLGLISTYNFLTSISWLPWAILGVMHYLQGKSILFACLPIVLSLLGGEPVATIIISLSIALYIAAKKINLIYLKKLILIYTTSILVSSIQLLPTFVRVLKTERTNQNKSNLVWSLSPLRLVEFGWPFFWGNPTKDEEGEYLGWNINDKNYPYILFISPGITLFLGALTLYFSRITLDDKLHLLKKFTFYLAISGLLLALRSPIQSFLISIPLSPLRLIRYPEKFILLTTVALTIGGITGIYLLLISEKIRTTFTKIAYIFLFLSLARVLILLSPYIRNELLEFALDPSIKGTLRENISSFVLHSSLLDLAVAIIIVILPVVIRYRMAFLSLLFLSSSIHTLIFSKSLLRIYPTNLFTKPPKIVDLLKGGRIFPQSSLYSGPEIFPPKWPVGIRQYMLFRERLDPYTALLWKLPYSLHKDYDMMQTKWGVQSFELLKNLWEKDKRSAKLYLAAWNTSVIIYRQTIEDYKTLLVKGITLTKIPTYRIEIIPHFIDLVNSVNIIEFIEDKEKFLQKLVTLKIDELNYLELSPIPITNKRFRKVSLEYKLYIDKILVIPSHPTEIALSVGFNYDPFWKVYTYPGKKNHRIYRSWFGKMIAVIQDKGYKCIVFEYKDPYIPIGAFATFITLGIMLFYLWKS